MKGHYIQLPPKPCLNSWQFIGYPTSHSSCPETSQFLLILISHDLLFSDAMNAYKKASSALFFLWSNQGFSFHSISCCHYSGSLSSWDVYEMQIGVRWSLLGCLSCCFVITQTLIYSNIQVWITFTFHILHTNLACIIYIM